MKTVVLTAIFIANIITAISSNDSLEYISLDMSDKICGLEFIEDGAQDEWGNFVYTASGLPQKNIIPGLNCTGFTKAIADYLFRQIYRNDKALSLDTLEHRYIDLRLDKEAAAYEYKLDPFYAQDWIRNCAIEINGTQQLQGDYWDIKKISGYDFDPRWGFHSEDIKEIISILYNKYPKSAYFFAVSKILNPVINIRQFAHAGLILPYTKNGDIIVDIFESNVINTLNRFAYVNEGRYIYLVRVDLSSFEE